MEPSQVTLVDVSSSACFPHPCSSLSDDLCEVLRNHDAEEVQSDVFKSNATARCVLKNMENICFLERKPVCKTSGRGSSSAIYTMSDRLSVMVKRETQYESPVTTSENILGPLGSNSSSHDLHNYYHPLLLLFLCQLVAYPSCTLLRYPCILMNNGICTPITHPLLQRQKIVRVMVGSSTINGIDSGR